MNNNKLIIGSRGSNLALVQAEFIKKSLSGCYKNLDIEIKIIKTTGDKILDVSLDKIGGKGLFTKEIEDALLCKEIDIAVHSMKDLPVELPRGLVIGAVTKRQDARDILVSEDKYSIKTLPENSRVGTSSLRRTAQLLNARPDLKIIPLRGNLDTRVRKLQEGAFDAIVVACAGIKRLGLKINSCFIPLNFMLPQAGQGSLGIEIRKDDSKVAGLVRMLNNLDAYTAVSAERALLGGLGGGCHAPIGAYARIESGALCLEGGVFSIDGEIAIKHKVSGRRDKAEDIGKILADNLLKRGAKRLLEKYV